MNTTNIRKILADRLREWMALTPAMDVQTKVAKHSGVAQATVQRILARKSAATVDNLDRLAGAFGRSACELLEDPGVGGIRYDRAAYARLSQTEKLNIERYISFVIAGAMQLETEVKPKAEERDQVVRAGRRAIGDQTLNLTDDGTSRESKSSTHKKRASSKRQSH